MVINQEQLALDSNNNPTVGSWFDGFDVIASPAENAVRTVTVPAGQDYALIHNVHVSGQLAVGLATQVEGLMVAAMPTALGTPSDVVIRDSAERVLNLVEIRSTDGNTITETDTDNEIMGLLHVAPDVTDGATVGLPGFENVQVSFVVLNPDGTFRNVPLSATVASTIRFGKVATYKRSEFERLRGVSSTGGSVVVINNQTTLDITEYKTRILAVVTRIPANTIINITDGSAAAGSASIVDGSDVIAGIGNSAAEFAANDKLTVEINGLQAVKGVHVTWVSPTAISLPLRLFAGNVIVLKSVEVAPAA